MELIEPKGNGFTLTSIARDMVEAGHKHWQRVQVLEKELEDLRSEKENLKQSRQVLVQKIQEIATEVGVKFPAPDKIITEIKRLKSCIPV
jgi:phage shock protein A